MEKDLIEFADWIAENNFGKFQGKWSSIYDKNRKSYTTKELLKLYKYNKIAII